MPDTDILLSICVPTFNRKFLLERNVSFHLAEFRKLGISFEVVVVDDCSTDETADYLASLAIEPELSAYRRVRNSGFLSNYAFAMQRAKGRYAVFLGDDDLLIPEKVLEYVQIMEGDPKVGMVQAPWLLVDARPGGGDMRPFYHLPSPTLIDQGDFAGFLKFIFEHRVFPEFNIIRRDVLARAISAPTPFIFWAFLYAGRALKAGDILFMPEPFARVTAISNDPRMQQGNKECMFQWDTYRGGLEYLASHAIAQGQFGDRDRGEVAVAIMDFMASRHAVALRLLIQGKYWVEAYILYHRMSAYRQVEDMGVSVDILRTLAGLTTALGDASEYSDGPIIVDPTLDAAILAMLPPKLLERLTHEVPEPDADNGHAWLRVSPDFGAPAAKDAVFDLTTYCQQYF